MQTAGAEPRVFGTISWSLLLLFRLSIGEDGKNVMGHGRNGWMYLKYWPCRATGLRTASHTEMH